MQMIVMPYGMASMVSYPRFMPQAQPLFQVRLQQDPADFPGLKQVLNYIPCGFCIKLIMLLPGLRADLS
jgi:hypothetical protein